MRITFPLLLISALGLAACSTGSGPLLDSGPNLPPEQAQVEALPTTQEITPPEALAPSRPATKNNVVAFEYAAAFNYADLAKNIDATFRACWIGKNPEFSEYAYGGLSQNGVQYVITLSENVNGQMMDLVKVTVIPASGQDGYAVSLESRAEGSAGEKTIKDGIRRIIGGQKVCG